MTVGSRIKHWRHILVMPARVLAKRAGISTASVYHYEKEKRKPSLRTQIDLAHAFGIQVCKLWEGLSEEEIRRAKRSRVGVRNENYN